MYGKPYIYHGKSCSTMVLFLAGHYVLQRKQSNKNKYLQITLKNKNQPMRQGTRSTMVKYHGNDESYSDHGTH